MAYRPIENYGIIGNMRMVGSGGHERLHRLVIAIHTLTRPAFSERSWMTKREAGSKFSPPAADDARHKQFYCLPPNVLVIRSLL